MFNCSGNQKEKSIEYTQKEMRKKSNHITIKIDEAERKAVREERRNNKATEHRENNEK